MTQHKYYNLYSQLNNLLWKPAIHVISEINYFFIWLIQLIHFVFYIIKIKSIGHYTLFNKQIIIVYSRHAIYITNG